MLTVWVLKHFLTLETELGFCLIETRALGEKVQ